MEKTYMFQYVYDRGFHGKGISFSDCKTVEDTGLISLDEAEALWEKYLPKVIENLKEDERPQMCIWKYCNSETDYGAVLKEIDFRDDLEVVGNKIYKKTLTEIA